MDSKRNGKCNISFQPSSCNTYPQRSLIDTGRSFNSSKGFGWSESTTSHFRDRRCQEKNRNTINAIATNNIDACLVHFQPNTTWKIELGAGEWDITIRCGDATYPSTISLDANHKAHRLMGLQLDANQFYDWNFTTAKGTSTIFLSTTVGQDEHKSNWTRIISFQAKRATRVNNKGMGKQGATLFKNSLRTATSVAAAPKGALTGLVQRDWVRDVKIEEKQAKWRARVLRLKYCWKRAGKKARNVATAHNLSLDAATTSSSKTSTPSSLSSSTSTTPIAEESQIQEVCAMGFARNHAVTALSEKYNSVPHAVEWLLSNMDRLPPPDMSNQNGDGNDNDNGNGNDNDNGNGNGNGNNGNDYGGGLSTKNMGRRTAKKQMRHPIVSGRAEAISGQKYDAEPSREGK